MLSKSTENVAEKVASENEGDVRGSRDLIREYLMRTRIHQPPAIFQTPFETYTNPMPMDLVYRYPGMDTDSSVYREKNRDMEIKYYDDNYSIDLLNSQSKSEDESSANKSVISAFATQDDQPVKSTRIEGSCRLIGKVNPNILKTWEQLRGGNTTDGEKVQKILYETQIKQSSSIFYDSIDNSIGTVVSDAEEAVLAAGEVMAECDSMLDKKNSNCWSIESENKYIIN